MGSQRTHHAVNLLFSFSRVLGPERHHGYYDSRETKRGLAPSHSLAPRISCFSHAAEGQRGRTAWSLVEEVEPQGNFPTGVRSQGPGHVPGKRSKLIHTRPHPTHPQASRCGFSRHVAFPGIFRYEDDLGGSCHRVSPWSQLSTG